MYDEMPKRETKKGSEGVRGVGVNARKKDPETTDNERKTGSIFHISTPVFHVHSLFNCSAQDE